MAIKINRSDAIKSFAQKAGISTHQSEKVFKGIMGANDAITSTRKLEEIAKKAIKTSEEMGYSLYKSGEDDYHFRKNIEKHLKTSAQDDKQGQKGGAASFFGGFKSVFGLGAKKNKPKTEGKSFLDTIRKVETAVTDSPSRQSAPIAKTTPQHVSISSDGFSPAEKGQNVRIEPPAPDIG